MLPCAKACLPDRREVRSEEQTDGQTDSMSKNRNNKEDETSPSAAAEAAMAEAKETEPLVPAAVAASPAKVFNTRSTLKITF